MTVRVVRRARVAERYMQQVNTKRSEDLMVVRNARKSKDVLKAKDRVFETDRPKKKIAKRNVHRTVSFAVLARCDRCEMDKS